MSHGPVAAAPGGVRLAIRLSPRARASRIDGVVHRDDGSQALKISVNALPSEGRANAALLQLLAKELGMPQRDLTLVSGMTSRNKTVHVAGDSQALLARLSLALSLPLAQG